MNRRFLPVSVRSALLVVLAGFALTAGAVDPAAKKPERRLPPTGSQSSDIPAGVDTGSPATSSSMQLGTPVPPAAAADRGDQNKRSAAARLASRPASAPSGVGEKPIGPVVTTTVKKPAVPPPAPR